MRTEQEMYNLILDFAKNDIRVRAVLQNGSRSNPNVVKDKYQDFDIVYFVTDVEAFTNNHSWIDCFGKRLMLQMPNAMRDIGDSVDDGSFTYLMLFEDGNRIDLTLIPINADTIKEYDCLTVCLLDKDGILPKYQQPSDKDFIVGKPSELFYNSCCNNFFWCLQNVAKGIVRDELPYAMEMFNHYVRDEINEMVSWYIGTKENFNVSSGKMGKYLKKYLPQKYYEMYADTYSNRDYNNLWNAIDTACELFRILAKEVAKSLNYTYNQQDDDGMIRYLRMIKDDCNKHVGSYNVRIETDRLILREVVESDYGALCKILKDEEVMYAYEGAFDEEQTRNWFNRLFERYKNDGFALNAVVLKDTGEMIGQCGLSIQNWRDEKILEIGYLFQKKHWHKGYATEAVRACKDYAFKVLNVDKVYSIIRDTNIASQNVAKRNGMKIIDTWSKYYRGIEMPHYLFCVENSSV